MDNATKKGIDNAKTASERVVKTQQELKENKLEIKQHIKLLSQVKQKLKKMKDEKFTYHQTKNSKFLTTKNYKHTRYNI